MIGLFGTSATVVVFYGVSPSLSLIMVLVRDELKFWGLAGARGISYLIALALRGQGCWDWSLSVFCSLGFSYFLDP